MRITLEQFCEQWAPKGNGRYLPNKMEFNTHDFVTMAGDRNTPRAVSAPALPKADCMAAASCGRSVNPAGDAVSRIL